MRLFLSYSSRDRAAAEAVVAALKSARPSLETFFDQQSLAVGGFWMPRLHQEIEKADGFVFLFGDRLGPWQTIEYYGAFDRRAKAPDLPITPVLLGEAGVPGLPFFNQLHWIKADPASPDVSARILAGLDGATDAPQQLWRLVNPYRGLQALREEDAALLHGRDALVAQMLEHIASTSGKVAIAVGNSGVGKSSLIYAGIFAALARQHWIGGANGRAWPVNLADSRSWLRLALKPSGKGGGSDNPLRELARTFIGQWRDATKPDYHADVDAWTARLESSAHPIDELVHASDRWAETQGLPPPSRYVLYVDQAEELYTRVDKRAAEAFSRVLSEAARLDRVRVLMSLRADFYGKLQDDTALFAASEKIDVPKLDDRGFRDVVSGPATMLGATFEEGLADQLVTAAVAQPVGLPLLSYQLTETWNEMVGRGDGTLRWPKRTETGFDLARALIDRADGYLRANPAREDAVRRLFCVRLVHVPEQGAPTRRVALQDELSPDEQVAAQDLSSPDYRLLAAGETDTGKPSIEVGHEALLTAWERLRNWIADRRGFYAWRTRLEGDRKEWERAGRPKNGLLAGRPLEIAQAYVANFKADIPEQEAAFVAQSADAATRARTMRRAAAAAAFATLFIAFVAVSWLGLEAGRQRDASMMTQSRFLAGQSSTFLTLRDPETALMVALEALPRSLANPDRPYVEAPMQALLNLWPVMHTNDARQVVAYKSMLARSGDVVVSLDSNGVVRIWDARTLLPIGPPLRDELPIVDFALNPDGSRIATMTAKRALIWDGRSGALIAATAEHPSEVIQGLFTHDGSRFVTCVKSNVFLWDVESGRQIGDALPNDAVFGTPFLDPEESTLLTYKDGNVWRWDIRSGNRIGTLSIGAITYGLTLSPSGRRMVGRNSNSVRLWDVRTGKPVASLTAAGPLMTEVQYSRDGKYLLIASGTYELDGSSGRTTLQVYDGLSGRLLDGREWPTVIKGVGAAGGKIWVWSNDAIEIWHQKSSGAFGERSHVGSGDFVGASPDGRHFAYWQQVARNGSEQLYDSVAPLANLVLWDSTLDRATHVTSERFLGGVRSPVQWNDGATRFIVSRNGVMVGDDPGLATYDEHGKPEKGGALWVGALEASPSPDDSRSLNFYGTSAELFDTENLQSRGTWQLEGPFPTNIVWSTTGSRAISWHQQAIEVWSANGAPPRRFLQSGESRERFTSASFLDPEGRYVLLVIQQSSDVENAKRGQRTKRTVRIVSSDTNAFVGEPTERMLTDYERADASVSADGRLAFLLLGDTLELRELATGATLGRLSGFAGSFGFFGKPSVPYTFRSTLELWDVRFSAAKKIPASFVIAAPDGVGIAIVDPSRSRIEIWQGDGTQRQLSFDKEIAVAPAFDAKWTSLLVAYDDGTLRLWDVETSRPVGKSAKHVEVPAESQFAASGSRIVTIPERGLVQIWDGRMTQKIGDPFAFQSVGGEIRVDNTGEYVILADYSLTAFRALRTEKGFSALYDSASQYRLTNQYRFATGRPGLVVRSRGSGYYVPFPPSCQELIDWAWGIADKRNLSLTPTQRKQLALPEKADREKPGWSITGALGALLPSTGETCH